MNHRILYDSYTHNCSVFSTVHVYMYIHVYMYVHVALLQYTQSA